MKMYQKYNCSHAVAAGSECPRTSELHTLKQHAVKTNHVPLSKIFHPLMSGSA